MASGVERGRGRGGRAAARGRRRRRLHRGRASSTPGRASTPGGASPRASRPSGRRAGSSAGTRSRARSRCGAGTYGPPSLRLSGAAAREDAGARRLPGPGEPDPRAGSRRRPRRAPAGRAVRRAALLARLAALALVAGAAFLLYFAFAPVGDVGPPPLQPRPQRGVARAPLAGAAPARAGDGGALREAARARHRLRLPARHPLRRGRPAPPARPRADARLPRRRPPRRPRPAGAAVDRRPAEGLQAAAAGDGRARRPRAAAAHGGGGAGPRGRGLRRRAPRRGAGRRRQRRVPGAAAGPAHGGRPGPRPLGERDPAGAGGPAPGPELRLEPGLLRAGGRDRGPDRDHGLRHRAAHARRSTGATCAGPPGRWPGPSTPPAPTPAC